jgi:hypothetical protein
MYHGNMVQMRMLRPGLGAYFLNDDTGNIHQWTDEDWESVGCNGTPEKAKILLLLQQQAQARANSGVGVGGGGGSSPGSRRTSPGGPLDPSVDDPVLFVPPPPPPPVPPGVYIYGGMDVPIGTGDPMGQGNPAGVSTIFDDFNRVVPPTGWGNASSGPAYVWAQVAADCWVNGTEGEIQLLPNGGAGSGDESFVAPLGPNDDCTVTYRLRSRALDAGGLPTADSPDFSDIIVAFAGLAAQIAGGGPTIDVLDGAGGFNTAFISATFWSTLPAGEFALLVIQRAGTTYRAKIYHETDPDPGWQAVLLGATLGSVTSRVQYFYGQVNFGVRFGCDSIAYTQP